MAGGVAHVADASYLFWKACLCENEDSMRLLCDQADVNWTNTIDEVGLGQTPLTWAAGCCNYRTLAFLLSLPQIDPNRPSAKGYTPLMWAAMCGHDEVVRRLVHDPRVQVNLVDPLGATALFHACRGPLENGSVALLLSRPEIDVQLAGSTEELGLVPITPLKYAMKTQNNAAVRLLRRH